MKPVSIALIGLLAGCSATEEAATPLHWTTLKDGSQVAQAGRDALTSGPKEAIRCWKAVDKFDCISMREEQFSPAIRTLTPTLPAAFLPEFSDKIDAGYDCHIAQGTGGYLEYIYNQSGRLTQNVESWSVDMERGWTKAYVDGYLRENNIEPVKRWFDCASLTKVIKEGSLATLGSTSVSQALLDGKVGDGVD